MEIDICSSCLNAGEVLSTVLIKYLPDRDEFELNDTSFLVLLAIWKQLCKWSKGESAGVTAGEEFSGRGIILMAF